MGIIKDINVDGRVVRFKASAAIPRLYRMKFSRDIYKDLLILDKINKNKGNIDIESLEIFENIAYIMAYHADDKISNDVGEWLEQFDTLSVYKLLPDLIKLWGINVKTMSTSKKKQKKLSGH